MYKLLERVSFNYLPCAVLTEGNLGDLPMGTTASQDGFKASLLLPVGICRVCIWY